MWKTRDGQLIEYSDMTDRHIYNAICAYARKVEITTSLKDDTPIEDKIGYALKGLYPIAKEAFSRKDIFKNFPKFHNGTLSFEQLVGAIIRANSFYDDDYDDYDDMSWHPGHPDNFGDR